MSVAIINEAGSLTLESLGRARNVNQDTSQAEDGDARSSCNIWDQARRTSRAAGTFFLANVKILISESFDAGTTQFSALNNTTGFFLCIHGAFPSH